LTREVSLDALVAVIRDRGAKERSVTAVAGPPGAGKSTLAEALAERLNAAEAGSAAVLPMDGYHFDDAILNARGWRPRKGAPHTFDVAGYAAMLARLRENAEAEVAVPVFDRSIEIARNAARMIPREVRHLVTEGNYLLLDEAPWTGLAVLFDTTVFLDVPMEVLRTRLGERWRDLGPEEFTAKLEANDLPNARKVVEGSRPAEFVLREGWGA
jgi:pantothenate kinase